jgi:hypothetical protein
MKITFPRDDFIDGWIEVGLEQGIAQGEATGMTRGEARILLRVLAARGFQIPDDIRDTVLTCTDTSQLEAWADLAAIASSIDEVFKR